MKLRPTLRTSFSGATLIAALAMTQATNAADICTLYPGVEIYMHGTHVVAVYGTPMTTGSTPEVAVENWITEVGDTLGVENLDLQPIRSNSIGAGHLTVVAHQQFMDGLPVEGGFTHIMVDNGPPNRVVHVGARLAQPPASGLRTPQIDGPAALLFVQGLPAYAGLSDWSTPEDVILGGGPNGPVTPAVRCWKFRGAAQAPAPLEAYTFFVDAFDESLVHVRDEVYHGGEITGQVSGWATPTCDTSYDPPRCYPDRPDNEAVQVCLEDVLVEVVGGGSAYTW